MLLDSSIWSTVALYSVQLATICPESSIIILFRDKKVHENKIVSSHLCFWKLHPAFSLPLKSKGWPTTVEIKFWWPLKYMGHSASNNESLKNIHQQEGRKPVWVYKLWFSLKEKKANDWLVIVFPFPCTLCTDWFSIWLVIHCCSGWHEAQESN